MDRLQEDKVDSGTEEALKNKSEQFAKKHNTTPRKLYNAILKVFKRGVGAYKTSPGSVRPSVKAKGDAAGKKIWGMGRVNSWLKKEDSTYGGSDKDIAASLKEDVYGPTHVAFDTLFLGEAEDVTYDDYPAAAKNNAQQAIDWKEEHGDEVTAMTAVGWRRARQLASGQKVSRDVISRMAQFNRHRKNAKVSADLKATPWKDNGHVAWLGWGGTEGVDWAIAKMDEIEKQEESVSRLDESFVERHDALKSGVLFEYARILYKTDSIEVITDVDGLRIIQPAA